MHMQYRTVSHIGGLEPQTAGRALCKVVVSRRVDHLGLKETVNRSLCPLREIRGEKGEDEENENSQDVPPHILTPNATGVSVRLPDIVLRDHLLNRRHFH